LIQLRAVRTRYCLMLRSARSMVLATYRSIFEIRSPKYSLPRSPNELRMHQLPKSVSGNRAAALAPRRKRANAVHARSPQSPQVRQFPQKHPVPAWLKFSIAMQRLSLLLFCGTFGLSALLYGYTAYTQDVWKTQHGRLQRLQRQELQQATVAENLRHQLAETAELPSSGLVNPTTDRLVAISTASQRQAKSPVSTPVKSTAPSNLPTGY
jgi:hypothetical protein